MSRILAELLHGIADSAQPTGEIPPGLTLSGVATDSRNVQPGMLFVAMSGSREDGRRHIQEALQRGATAVLHDETAPLPELPAGVARLQHPRPRQALAWLAAAWHNHPAQKLRCVAVTGTNGKTSSVGMVASILNQAGEGCGVIGTTGIRWPQGERPNAMTTPDPLELQEILARMVQDGCRAVAMEASSHALDQYRVEGIPFAAGIFTNLTRDHLDYHGTMEAYFRAKARLFLELPVAVGAFWRGDPWGRVLEERARNSGLKTRLFQRTPQPGVVAATQVSAGWMGTRFRLWSGDDNGPQPEIHLPVAGEFNLLNGLGAATACLEMGIEATAVARGLAGFVPVKGRMEPIHKGQPFAVVVDYAHTPDALERLLTTARTLTPGRLLVVFGCGGDRDGGKRPLMGEIAGRLADKVMVTDDNPRSEDPAAIRAAILNGVRASGGAWEEMEGREAAIHAALQQAGPGDGVLLAGKGHETVQIIGTQRLPFDDAAVARAGLATLGYRG